MTTPNTSISATTRSSTTSSSSSSVSTKPEQAKAGSKTGSLRGRTASTTAPAPNASTTAAATSTAVTTIRPSSSSTGVARPASARLDGVRTSFQSPTMQRTSLPPLSSKTHTSTTSSVDDPMSPSDANLDPVVARRREVVRRMGATTATKPTSLLPHSTMAVDSSSSTTTSGRKFRKVLSTAQPAFDQNFPASRQTATSAAVATATMSSTIETKVLKKASQRTASSQNPQPVDTTRIVNERFARVVRGLKDAVQQSIAVTSSPRPTVAVTSSSSSGETKNPKDVAAVQTNEAPASTTHMRPLTSSSSSHETMAGGDDSDGELSDSVEFVSLKKPAKGAKIEFEKIPAKLTTIRCADGNLKAEAFIKIAHQVVKDIYREIFKLRKKGEPPKVQWDKGKYILLWENPYDWFTTLGGWQGDCKSSAQVKASKATLVNKFGGVNIHGTTFFFDQSGAYFRLCLPRQFEILNCEVNENKKGEKFIKQDISYTGIVMVIGKIKEKYSLRDSDIALLQLKRHLAPMHFENIEIPEIEENKVLQFLDFLNALMFGTESSGLNSGLVTGLMLLDLIAANKFSYEKAFNDNVWGGIAPFACVGDHEGAHKNTFGAHDELLQEGSPSIKEYRVAPSKSPVAVKEAMLIRNWLISNEKVNRSRTQVEQTKAIKLAIYELIIKYMLPAEPTVAAATTAAAASASTP